MHDIMRDITLHELCRSDFKKIATGIPQIFTVRKYVASEN